MNLQQLETLVWSWLDDVNGGYFLKSQVDVWLQNGQKELQKLLIRSGNNYYVTKMKGQLITGQESYVLPSDFKKCHKLEIVIDGTVGTSTEVRQTLEYVTLMQLEQVWQSQGRPCAYNIKRNIVSLRPIPDQNYTMYLHQSYQCADMVNPQDIPDAPEDYHEYIAVLATLDGFLKDQRDPSAFVAAKREKYEKMLQQDAAERNLSQPRMVVVTEPNGWGMLF